MIKIEVQRPRAAGAPTGFALWNLGFRPFYLLASIFASSSILLWICQYAGQLPATYLPSPAWHGHEMLFGYTMAVVAGFLLTAVANWTGKPTSDWRCPDRAGGALGGRPRAGPDPLCHRCRDCQCSVSLGVGHRHRQSCRTEPEPAQLFLPRVAPIARLRRACVSPFASGPASVAGAGEPPGRPRCHSVHHGRHRRASDSDVHQQRRPRCAGYASPAGREIRAGRCARVARGSTFFRPPPRSVPCLRSRLRLRTQYDSTCGSRGELEGRLWSGCCTSPMAGLLSTSYCVDWRRSE